MKSYSESYKASGVDITAGYKAVELMKSHIARTMTAGALGGVGGFGGLFAQTSFRFSAHLPEKTFIFDLSFCRFGCIIP